MIGRGLRRLQLLEGAELWLDRLEGPSHLLLQGRHVPRGLELVDSIPLVLVLGGGAEVLFVVGWGPFGLGGLGGVAGDLALAVLAVLPARGHRIGAALALVVLPLGVVVSVGLLHDHRLRFRAGLGGVPADLVPLPLDVRPALGAMGASVIVRLGAGVGLLEVHAAAVATLTALGGLSLGQVLLDDLLLLRLVSGGSHDLVGLLVEEADPVLAGQLRLQQRLRGLVDLAADAHRDRGADAALVVVARRLQLGEGDHRDLDETFVAATFDDVAASGQRPALEDFIAGVQGL